MRREYDTACGVASLHGRSKQGGHGQETGKEATRSKGCDHFKALVLVSFEEPRETVKVLLKIANYWAEIETGYLLNTSRKSHCCETFLGRGVCCRYTLLYCVGHYNGHIL